jgi:hypothetical protein
LEKNVGGGMTARFTPGPWTFHDPWAGFSKITGPDGALIFGIARGEGDEAQPVKTCDANAALIEAAPDLYGALERLVRDSPIDDTNRIAMREAGVAMAKARGDE